ncbi:hypothetical protein [Echinicola shivajiensis]|uniref:hypothetical protein n=1 Tax=Echinicola shivajiensis TaxID=1035916 RepID=UPI001BFC07F6|nr:hypothetical protein [Echinicola shivajiensis]
MIKTADVRGFDIKKRKRNPQASRFKEATNAKNGVLQSIFRECKTTITGIGA